MCQTKGEVSSKLAPNKEIPKLSKTINMALTTEATTNLPASQTPSGWTNPATTITGTTFAENFTTTIAVSGVSHASNASTGLTALIAAVKSWIDGTFAPDTLHFDLTDTISGIITIKNVVRDNAESTSAGKLYITGTDTYTVSGLFQWK